MFSKLLPSSDAYSTQPTKPQFVATSPTPAASYKTQVLKGNSPFLQKRFNETLLYGTAQRQRRTRSRFTRECRVRVDRLTC